jgi:hypothetical protein
MSYGPCKVIGPGVWKCCKIGTEAIVNIGINLEAEVE